MGTGGGGGNGGFYPPRRLIFTALPLRHVLLTPPPLVHPGQLQNLAFWDCFCLLRLNSGVLECIKMLFINKNY